MEEKCTCDTETIEAHECPYSVEIHEDFEQCKCCDYCETKCCEDI